MFDFRDSWYWNLLSTLPYLEKELMEHSKRPCDGVDQAWKNYTERVRKENEEALNKLNDAKVRFEGIVADLAQKNQTEQEKSEEDNPVAQHLELCHRLNALYARKNADYGDSFHKTYLEEGDAMVRIRLTDKLNRFGQLTKSGEQHCTDESIIDTLLDLACYSLMAIMEYERKGQK